MLFILFLFILQFILFLFTLQFILFLFTLLFILFLFTLLFILFLFTLLVYTPLYLLFSLYSFLFNLLFILFLFTLLFILFLFTLQFIFFLFSMHIILSLLSWRFDVFRVLVVCFPFSTIPFILYLHPILETDDWKTTNVFCHIPLWIAFLNVFCDIFHCFNWQFFCWGQVPFQSSMPNRILGSARTLF